MELKLSTQTLINSVLYTRLLELFDFNKTTKKKLLSKVPLEKDLDMYVFNLQHYNSVRQAYIEFCNECGTDVDLHFEESECEEAQFKEDEEEE